MEKNPLDPVAYDSQGHTSFLSAVCTAWIIKLPEGKAQKSCWCKVSPSSTQEFSPMTEGASSTI